MARTAGGWTVDANSVSPASALSGPDAPGGSERLTHSSIGAAVSGASKILYSGTLTPNIVVSDGVTPKLKTSSTITED